MGSLDAIFVANALECEVNQIEVRATRCRRGLFALVNSSMNYELQEKQVICERWIVIFSI